MQMIFKKVEGPKIQTKRRQDELNTNAIVKKLIFGSNYDLATEEAKPY